MHKDLRNYSILIIEDNIGDVTLIEEYLLDYIDHPHLLQAKNFQEAKIILTDSDIHFDVILLDLTLPDKYGEALVREIIKLSRNIPVLVLTGLTDIGFSIDSMAMGVSDYLLKNDLNAPVLYKSIFYAIERKKSDSLVKLSEKRYSDLFHLSPQPMWLYELKNLKFIQVNNAAIEKYGYSEAEFLAMTILDIRPGTDRQKTLDKVKDRIEGDNFVFSGQFKHLIKSGQEIDVEIYSTPIEINNISCRSVIAIDVTERVQLEEKVTRAILKTQEEERYEIGSELHDNVCQILGTSQMYLDVIDKSITDASRKHYTTTKELIAMAINEIRNLSHRLAPVFFEESSFRENIVFLLDKYKISSAIKINLEYSEEVDQILLQSEIKLNLYRILQEMLRNTMKYANATEILIQFNLQQNFLVIILSDNGVGFTYQINKSGIGLANMKRRAELFGGSFELVTAPNEGCRITVKMPV